MTALDELAQVYGVARSYDDHAQRPVRVEDDTVVAVLGALGVDASTEDAAHESLQRWHAGRADRLIAPTVVRAVGLSVAGADDPVDPIAVGARVRTAVLVTESGARSDLQVSTDRSAVTITLPTELEPGWHRITVVDEQGATADAVLVAHPPRIELPAGLDRAWGWMLQLYSVRSSNSWGIGDYADLRDIVAWSGAVAGGGAGLVLCNPLHAITPVAPIENSPYSPSSRRFRSPLYLRVTDLAEYRSASAAVRQQMDALRPASSPERIDRDAVWVGLLAAAELLYPLADRARINRFRAERGRAVQDFALFCALAERHGADWREWPEPLRDVNGAAAQRARATCADRIDFHVWLQLCCDDQLAAADDAARAAGMPVGVVHDLAVGVDAGGADAWALADVLAEDATVGAPPDSFNQLGQDWGLPPWHPQRLAETGYAPFRDMIRSVLAHAGGIRIDHVMGLFRLWWVPVGNTADRGSYVRYDSAAMLGVLALEAHRAGAVVVGEDLGTVEPAVTRELERIGVLGSDVAWFAVDATDSEPLPPRRWRRAAMASVTTHDLPTVRGWLTDEPIRVRDQLGQLGVSVAQERDRMRAERTRLLTLLEDSDLIAEADAAGVIDADPADPDAVTLALHRLLVAAPCRLVVAAPGDAVGDVAQPNLPGTRDEYPNWRLPVADAAGHRLTLEELVGDPRVAALARVLGGVTSGDPSPNSGEGSDTVT